MLIALCVTEITSWGVLYYAFPVLAPSITADTGWSTTTITAAFSAALVVAALGGIPVGRILDRRGPHTIMTIGSVIGTASVAAIALAPSPLWFAVAWLLAGTAMTAVLYQPAFAALTRYYHPRHVGALTTLTLVAGLASTVFAPLTDALTAYLSWRGVYLALAVILAVVTVPLHALALRRPWPPAPRPRETDTRTTQGTHHTPVFRIVRTRPFVLTTVALTLAGFASIAVVVNLIPLLTARGVGATAAAWALGLGGVGQVTGRLGYGALARRTTVRGRTVWVLSLSAVSIAILAAVPGHVLVLIAVSVLAGATRGIATLVQATAVSDRWGTASYGALSGVLSAPVTVATAVSPWAGAALATMVGGYRNLFFVLAGCAAVAALLAFGSVPAEHRSP